MKKKQSLVLAAFVIAGLMVMLLWQELAFNDGKLHVIFCDVGQGDAIFIRTPGKQDLLIDGGPDRKVLDCLSRHMPFWDKTLELVVLTHPHQDHLGGLVDVLSVYAIGSFVLPPKNAEGNETVGYKTLKKTLLERKVSVLFGKQGLKIVTPDGTHLAILSPQQNAKFSDINDASLIFLLTFLEFDVLLPGDASSAVQKAALSSLVLPKPLEVLKVSHHGSRHGLDRQLLELLSPSIAIISAGRSNRYGHPHEEILKILRDKPASPAGRDIRILRTDQDGEVEIVTDGKTLLLLP